jgi:hypothetical protein
MKRELSAAQLRDALDYDPETGVFRWKIRPNLRIQVGKIAGTLCNGYVRIKLDDFCHAGHRLAWLHVYGAWPSKQMDHVNGVRSDNRIANLRDVPILINRQNQRRAHRRNRVGLLGVSKSSQRRPGFRARIDHIHLGTYPTPEQAHAVYVSAKRIRHEGNTL